MVAIAGGPAREFLAGSAEEAYGLALLDSLRQHAGRPGDPS